MTRRSRRPEVALTSSARTTSELAHAADDEFALWLAERLRRIALGLTAALIAARVYWPSEFATEADTGNGLDWVLALLFAAGLAVAALLIGGITRLRVSWADLPVYLLMLLVGLSATRGAERRVAINLAWEWGALGIAYFLVRNLPRTRGESSALAGALTAAAVAVSAYGLYQVSVEFPQMHASFRKDPNAMLQKVGIAPSNAAARKAFEDRLLGSNEVYATFALANSLAGFLVGPLVLALAVVLENLRTREGQGARGVALVTAALPVLVLLACLLLTKSRSSYAGLLVALVLLLLRQRGRISARTLALAVGALSGVLGVLVVAAAATRHLDIQVLTDSTKSLRYRMEYWVGSWRAIWNIPGAFWNGLGPGNFAGPYLRYKLPQASEEILDPHNLVLEVWATAGLWAVLALLAALGLGLWEALGPSRVPEASDRATPPLTDAAVSDVKAGKLAKRKVDPSAPPDRAGWLIVCAGLSWVLVTLLGRLNPFAEGLMARWLILGTAWPIAVWLGLPLWTRVPIPALGFGAAVLAVAINLLAAGGIGYPAVALPLWTMFALGLNLRDDRPCSQQRVVGRRFSAFSLAVVWAALVGSYAGAILPFWKSEAAMAEADSALAARPPQLDRARDAYSRAHELDKLSVRPWVALAETEYLYWRSRGAKGNDPIWKMVSPTFDKALKFPRNPNSLDVQRRRAELARSILSQGGAGLPLIDVLKLRAEVVKAYRSAAQLYPTSAILHAELAEASADLGDEKGAVEAATEALRLDRLNPHADKKLPDDVRKRLVDDLARWTTKPESK